MSNLALRIRRGLGPGVDPHFDAWVGHAIAARGASAVEPASRTAYIELAGERPGDALRALFDVLYGREPGGGWLSGITRRLGLHDVPATWRNVTALRYLTTDSGLALPLHDFNPAPTGAGAGARGADGSWERLERIAGGRLDAATLIGLTVEIDLRELARALEPLLLPGPLRRLVTTERGARAGIDQVLRGGVHPWWGAFGSAAGPRIGARGFPAQDFGAAAGFAPQLVREMRELRNGVPTDAAGAGYGFGETGRGTIVGFVDFGCDFAHGSFRVDRRSRILSLWDQNAAPESDGPARRLVDPGDAAAIVDGERCRFGYGRVFERAQIDVVLAKWLDECPDDAGAPYRMLGYHPHDHHYTTQRPGDHGSAVHSAHGTQVMDIAVGGRRDACSLVGEPSQGAEVHGVAPGADIVFVQVRTHRQSDGRKLLDANDVVDAVAFIFHEAERVQRPCVVNLSLNTMSGPHEGDGHFERRLSYLLRSGSAGPAAAGRSVVVAAGNVPRSEDQQRQWQHLDDGVRGGAPFEFVWHLGSGDQTRNSVEVWYDADGAWLRVYLVSPAGAKLGPVAPGEAAELLDGANVVGSVIGSRFRPRLRDNDAASARRRTPAGAGADTVAGRHVILLQLDPRADTGDWTIGLEAVGADHVPVPTGSTGSVRFHAWLERDDGGPSGIRRGDGGAPISDSDRSSTIGTLSCGSDAIVVGAYDTFTDVASDWGLSARGPGRQASIRKPDLCAPGNKVLAVSSAPASPERRCVVASGTSIAAPFVTGAIACMYEVKPDATLDEVRRALVETTRRDAAAASWSEALGHGRLNPAAAVQAMRSVANTAASPA